MKLSLSNEQPIKRKFSLLNSAQFLKQKYRKKFIKIDSSYRKECIDLILLTVHWVCKNAFYYLKAFLTTVVLKVYISLSVSIPRNLRVALLMSWKRVLLEKLIQKEISRLIWNPKIHYQYQEPATSPCAE